MLTIIIRCIFQEGKKLYPQIYLDECLYEYDGIDITRWISIINNSHLFDEMSFILFYKISLLYIKNEWHDLLSKKQRKNTK